MTSTDRFASLCVLSYNRPQFLDECLASLAADPGFPFELIVHDDGSQNPLARDVIYQEIEDGRISTAFINPPGHNQGQGVALNRMFAVAKGDPIIKLDQDLSNFRPGWLKTVVELLDSNHQLDGFVPGTRVEPRIGLLGLLHYHHDPVDSAKTRLEQFEGWSSRTHILGSAFAVTRECWKALGPFEEHSDAFAEDNAFQLKVAASQGFVCGLPDEDLVDNLNMGLGPSTIVAQENGEIVVTKINKQPVVFAP